MQRVSQPSRASIGNSRRSLTLNQLTSTLPDIITPATMIPPQVAPSSTSSTSTNSTATMGNLANSLAAIGATPTTTTNDFSTIEVLSIFRGHVPLDCSVPADRPGRMMVMKVFAKKVQHSKSVRFVNMLFDGESVKLLEGPSHPTSSLIADAEEGADLRTAKSLLLEIKGSAIDLVRLSKRDATFFYFTTRNATWDSLADGNTSPLLNYPLEGNNHSVTGFDVFAFHATSPRSAERCYRLLQQFAEMNASNEQLMAKFGPGAKAPGGFFHLAGSLLSTPSLMATVADAATNTGTTGTTGTTITNHNNNNITLCDIGKSPKQTMASSMKSLFGGLGVSGNELGREAHHVTFASGLETKRSSCNFGSEEEEEEESSSSSSSLQVSQPPSADLLLLCDFSSNEHQRQNSDASMSDLFDDLAMPPASPAKVLDAGDEVDLLGDLFKSSAPSTLPTSVPKQQQQQKAPHLPPPQQRPLILQPQPQQPMFVPSNPFAGASAPAYNNFATSNPFAATAVPLQPQPFQVPTGFNITNSGQFQSLGGGQGAQQTFRKSSNTSAFSTDFNDFLQQTVKGHFKV